MTNHSVQRTQLTNDQRKRLAQLLESTFERRITALDRESGTFEATLVATLAKEFGADKLLVSIQALQKEQETLEGKLRETGFGLRYESLEVIDGEARKRYVAGREQYQASVQRLHGESQRLSRQLWLAPTREEALEVLAEADRLTDETLKTS